jgi:hypothetical protein
VRNWRNKAVKALHKSVSKYEEGCDFSGGDSQHNVAAADVDLQPDSLDPEFRKRNLTLKTFDKSVST